TPGHEAFTKMRARGANVTDIAVIVVAATDGVMPQTEEAIAHARAADVDIIVAINKVDMPNANVDKTRRQLYQLNLLPDDMGGDIQFVETSAVTGQGIAELIDAISLQAELAEPPLVAEQERVLIREQELFKFSPVSIDSLRTQNARVKITELKVILKAEARGSVEAIKKELEKLVHEEVRCKVLHAGIGAISEADVTLA